MPGLFTDIKLLQEYTKHNKEESFKIIKANNNRIIYFLPVVYFLFLSINKVFNLYTEITWPEIGIIFILTGLFCFIYSIISNNILNFFLPLKDKGSKKRTIEKIIIGYFIFMPGNILVVSAFIAIAISIIINLYIELVLLILVILFIMFYFFTNSWKFISNISPKTFVLKKFTFTIFIFVGIIINPAVLLGIITLKYCIADLKITNKIDMMPTIGKRNVLIIDKISGLIKKPEYKDIVLVYYPERKDNLIPFSSLVKDIKNNDSKLFRRIIAMQDDSILIEADSSIILNNQKLSEPYLKAQENLICQLAFHCKEESIKVNNYYLLGDNRKASQDSRIWSSIDEKFIKGKVVFKIWPLKDFKRIK